MEPLTGNGMASSSTTASEPTTETTHVEPHPTTEETHATQPIHATRRPSHPDRQFSDQEKELLAALEGHDADIPSNEGYVLDERGELKRRQSIAALHRKASHATGKEAAKTDIEKGGEETSAEESDDNVVFWDGDNDPSNPLNFSRALKILNISLVSAICFVTPLGSSMFAPGVPELMEEFKSKNVLLASFVVSVYILGFAIGPLFFAPMSEIYGRLPIYHSCNLGFLLMTIACAKAPNLNALIGFRFLAGVFGSAPLTNGIVPWGV